MAKQRNLFKDIDDYLIEKKDKFVNDVKSEFQYKSNINSDVMSFEWLEQMEFACPYIDNVIRIAKIALIKEERVVNIEKSRKVTVESVKDLAKHADYISKFDKKTQEVEPEKILNIFNEETFNIYENRFLYTLIDHMNRFIAKREQELKNIEIIESKKLKYFGETTTNYEKVNIELKISSESFPSSRIDNKMKEQLKSIKARIKNVKDYLSSWEKSEMIKDLTKKKVKLINPPVKKTNIILKNANFQVALKLWDFILKYEEEEDDGNSNVNIEVDPLQKYLDYSFLINYCILDSMSNRKREERKKMSKYAILLLVDQIDNTLELLSSCGIDITRDELLSMIAKEMNKPKNTRLVGAEDVKKKFKSAIDEYLERTQNYL